MNIDGASKGNLGIATGGGVLRGDHGEWLQGFTENFGICTPVKAKLKAVVCGLRMVRELGFQKIWLQADSMIIVGML